MSSLYAGAVTIAATNRVTVSTELIGRRLGSGGRLVNLVSPHPSLVGVETIRLTRHRRSDDPNAVWRLGFVGTWHPEWLLNLNLLRPLTTAGLNARWMTSVSLDYALGN